LIEPTGSDTDDDTDSATIDDVDIADDSADSTERELCDDGAGEGRRSSHGGDDDDDDDDEEDDDEADDEDADCDNVDTDDVGDVDGDDVDVDVVGGTVIAGTATASAAADKTLPRPRPPLPPPLNKAICRCACASAARRLLFSSFNTLTSSVSVSTRSLFRCRDNCADARLRERRSSCFFNGNWSIGAVFAFSFGVVFADNLRFFDDAAFDELVFFFAAGDLPPFDECCVPCESTSLTTDESSSLFRL
jgi:hypothetical protein